MFSWLNKRIKKEELIVPPDISEPVISFLKVFEKNPRRFKIKSTATSSDEAYRGYAKYNFVDTLTKDKFSFLKSWFNNDEITNYGIKKLPNFLTGDEQKLIVNTLRNYYLERAKRLRDLKSIRTKRKQANERKRLTKVYQEG